MIADLMRMDQQVALIVTVPDAPEVSDIATAIFRARVAAHPGANEWPEENLAFLKRLAINDAKSVWAYLEKRGWRGYAETVSPDEFLT